MKKYYRVFEIVEGRPQITDDGKYNWFDNEEDAGIYLVDNSYKGKTYTVLPVWDYPSDY